MHIQTNMHKVKTMHVYNTIQYASQHETHLDKMSLKEEQKRSIISDWDRKIQEKKEDNKHRQTSEKGKNKKNMQSTKGKYGGTKNKNK